MEPELNLYHLWEVIVKRRLLLLLGPLLAVILSLLISLLLITPRYRSTTTLLVMKPPDSAAQILYQDIQVSRQLVDTYREIIHSRLVLDRVIENLGLQIDSVALRRMVDVQAVHNTEIITISVTHPEAALARDIADAVACHFISEVVSLYRVDNVNLIDRAALPAAPVSPRVRLNLAVALVLGLMTALGLIFLLENLDRTLKTPEDVEKYLEIPLLGIIPRIDG